MTAWIKSLASRVRGWLSPQQPDRDFEEELEEHLDMLTRDYLRRGLTLDDARRAARVRLGGITQLKETNRELRGLPILETLLQDSRYAVRTLRRNPGFTAVAVLTLAVGIGANTTLFSVVYAVLLKPLPYRDAQQLYNVFQEQLRDEAVKTGWSSLNLDTLRQENHSFDELAGSQHHQLTLTGRGEPAVVNVSDVTSEFFTVFAETPLTGRALSADDGKPGAAPVTVLSEGLWRRVFGADPNVIGTAIELDRRPFVVVGVMPSAFRFPLVAESEQLWIPVAQDPLFSGWMTRRSGHWLQVTGRLRPGVSSTQALAEMNALGARLASEFPAENSGWTIRMVPLQRMIVGEARSPLLLLLGAVGLVLLIGCVNIANLLLARATSRSREIALRSTLGAGRARIVRQLLSETMVLGVCGALAGIALAYGGVLMLSALLPASVPRVNPLRIDYVVLAFALFASAVATIGAGLAPAWLVARSDLQAGLRESGERSSGSAGATRARKVLAAAEVALAMVLLLTAGLLLQSFARLTAVHPGFDAQHLVKAEVSLPRFQYSKPQQWTAFTDELLTRLRAEPGTREVAAAVPLPIADGNVNLGFEIVGRPALSAGASRTADYVSVSPEYFRVLGVPLLAGRFFSEHDIEGAPRVAIISQVFRRVYFPDRDPIGQRLMFGFPPDVGVVREIVGVVGDLRDVALGKDPGPMMYVPFSQAPFWGAELVVKSASGPASVAAAIRRHVAAIDKNLPVDRVATMTDVLDASVAQARFRTLLLALFAAMAVLLAATGIFGVISYSVSCRRREIGVRVALGAPSGAILRMVLGETLMLALTGLAVGVPCALAASRLVASLLFDVSAHDPATLVAVVVALTVVSAVAGFVPVRRAMHVDPVDTLRQA